MCNRLPRALAFLGTACCLWGQSSTFVFSAGYRAPSAIAAAPGQVMTLFLRGKGPDQPLVASTTPLPTLLGGYAVQLEQTFADPVALPLFSVHSIQNCVGGAPLACNDYTAISVQIPFELVPNIPGERRPENFAVLAVLQGGVRGEAVPLTPLPDNIHIRNSCDTTTEKPAGPCLPQVLHADGTPVTPSSPAKQGETLRVQAYGVGRVPVRVLSGTRAPIATPIPDVTLGLDFRINAPPVMPLESDEFPVGSVPARMPSSTVLSPDAVGLYHVTFDVPAIPAGTPACSSAVASNLTITVARETSFDGAAICVQAAQ